MAGQNKTANHIFAAEEHNQQKIENSQFCKKIPDRLIHEEQCEEQNHPRVGGEEIQPTERRSACLQIGLAR